MKTWDRIVIKAWLARNEKDSPHRHPPKADRIYARYAANIDRVEAYLTAKRMVERYGYSTTYPPYDRAVDHAYTYPSSAWQHKYWRGVAENILRIQKEA